jgi:DNA-binding NarL/FixJ family response regulator
MEPEPDTDGPGATPEADETPLRVMIVDDHPMWRQAVGADLERSGVAVVVAEAGDGLDAVEVATTARADVILMDLILPSLNGVEATRRIVSAIPKAHILVLSASGEEADVLDAIKAGATGYLVKSATAPEVEQAVKRVARGEPVFTPSLAAVVLEEFRRMADHRSMRASSALPAEEADILRLVAKGYRYREIADRLSVPRATVRHAMQNVLGRLHLRHEGAVLEDSEDADGDEDAEALGGDGERVLATILFTDIVGSTELAVRLGDDRWRHLLERHHEVVRTELIRFRGREVDTAGDGFLSEFDQPARAVRCALAIVRSVRQLDLEIRAGIHTGEIERVGDQLRGIAVHIGSRIAALAGAGQVLVSSTVRDLVTGSMITFADAGARTLKGVPGEWRLFEARPEEPSSG